MLSPLLIGFNVRYYFTKWTMNIALKLIGKFYVKPKLNIVTIYYDRKNIIDFTIFMILLSEMLEFSLKSILQYYVTLSV